MAVKPVHAWQTSEPDASKNTFVNKNDAYKADAIYLCNQLKVKSNEFDKATDDKQFRKFLRFIEEWLTNAKALLQQMTTEPDVEVKRGIDGQG